MTSLPCECQELKPKGETNSSFSVLHPISGVHTVKTVGSHLKVIPQYCTAHPVLRIITRNKIYGKLARDKNRRLERHGWEKEVEICSKEGKDS